MCFEVIMAYIICCLGENIDERVKDLEQRLEESENRRKRDADDSKAQVTVLMDKVKRLKALLAKSRDLALEKDAQKQKLVTSDFADTGLLKRFSVQCRVIVHNTQTEQDDIWCILCPVFPFEPTGPSPNATESYHWAKECEVRKWLLNGKSELIGEWPAILQHHYEQREKTLIAGHEESKQVLHSEIADINKKFQIYKTKAQAALKRLGKDEHSERQRVYAEEEAQISELHDRIKHLERIRADCGLREADLEGIIASLRDDIVSLKSTVSELEFRGAIDKASIDDLRAELQRSVIAKNNSEDMRKKMEVELEAVRSRSKSKPVDPATVETSQALISASQIVPMKPEPPQTDERTKDRWVKEKRGGDSVFSGNALVTEGDGAGLLAVSQVIHIICLIGTSNPYIFNWYYVNREFLMYRIQVIFKTLSQIFEKS